MSRILDKLADQHEQRIIDVLYRLEEDVIKEVTRATGGKLVSQRLAIQLQPKIRNLIQRRRKMCRRGYTKKIVSTRRGKN